MRTVLAQPADHPHDRAVRWRQIVELLARSTQPADPELFETAIAEVKSHAASIDEQVRMAAARTIAPLSVPTELVCVFAADRLAVAAPVLATARLTASEWAEVSLAASPECRRFIASLRSETAAPEPRTAPSPSTTPASPQDNSNPGIPSIGEVLSRIETLRQSREGGASPPPLPSTVEVREQPRLFRWECDETGQIDWVDGAPRAAVIGRPIAQDAEGSTDRVIQRAFALRMPFRDADIELVEGSAVGGSWKFSGMPAFEPSSGRFAGYRGIAEREELGSEQQDGAAPASDPDSLRELVHEIKTPLNAIIGFAEMISGEYLGAASERYRERSQDIVSQARMLLAAVEDLDLTAKLCSPRAGECPEVRVGPVVDGLIETLRATADQRGVDLDVWMTMKELTVRIDPQLVERLIQRMCNAVLDRSSSGERLRLSVDDGDEAYTVSISRPQALRQAGEDPVQSDYWLRLTQMLARMTGVELVTSAEDISLRLPRA